MTKQEFIETIAKYVNKYRKDFNIGVSSPIIAQACLESSFGTSEKAKHNNFFGLKYRQNRVNCHNGYFRDGGSEQRNDGSYIPIQADWYSFENIEKGVLGYFQFTNTKNYSNLKGVTDPLIYLNNIKADGYATSKDYVKNVYNVITSYNLTKYDKEDIIIIKPEDTKTVYTNSPLVSYTNLTNHHGGERNHCIDTITIHCIVGQWSSKQGCDYFKNTDREASSNYIVGKDGDIGLSVEEKNRSFCSSNRDNDQRAITIETASDTVHPYAITDKALNSLILLCADICRRNNIKELKWSYDKNERINHINGVNMTCHRDFSRKSCPGDYIYEREEYISQEVNKLLKNNSLNNNINKPVTQINQNTENSDKFNFIKYSDDYPDLKKAFGYDRNKLWNHYQTYGKKEGRKVSFDLELKKDSFLVQVSIPDLNIRESHSVNSRSKGFIPVGIYTITETFGDWGKLKSGKGWINLKYVKKL